MYDLNGPHYKIEIIEAVTDDPAPLALMVWWAQDGGIWGWWRDISRSHATGLLRQRINLDALVEESHPYLANRVFTWGDFHGTLAEFLPTRHWTLLAGYNADPATLPVGGQPARDTFIDLVYRKE